MFLCGSTTNHDRLPGASYLETQIHTYNEQALVSRSQNSTANVERGNPKAVIIEGG